MIERYTRPALAETFSQAHRIELWLRIERSALAAIVAAGIAPQSALDALDAVGKVSPQDVAEREAVVHHDLAAFVDVVAKKAPGCASWLHYGLTSSDVLDTALGLQLREAHVIVLDGVRRCLSALIARAHEHRNTAILGRTHGMPAEPMSFGAKLAGWWHQLDRDRQRLETAFAATAVGKLSGAVGNYAQLPSSVEASVLAELGLARDPSATQVVQRDRHATLLSMIAICGGTLERFATEIRLLQRAEVGELREPFSSGQKGSSAMPHKRNPILAERVCGQARLLRGYSIVGLEDIALWHERDISHSSAERVALVDAICLLDYMLNTMAWLLSDMDVDTQRMAENLASQKGLARSQHALSTLVEHNVPRDRAYRVVQHAAAAVEAQTMPDLAAALKEHARELDVADIDWQDVVFGATALGDINQQFAELPLPDHASA